MQALGFQDRITGKPCFSQPLPWQTVLRNIMLVTWLRGYVEPLGGGHDEGGYES
jgi:hypothetical protein